MSKNLYFAYGSNLNQQDLDAWCHRKGYRKDSDGQKSPPILKELDDVVLPDFELAFSYRSSSRGCGVLDIKERAGQMVHGMLFEVNDDAWEILDEKEGAPQCYERTDVVVLNRQGHAIPAKTYRVRESRKQAFVEPNKSYLDVVRLGLRSWDLSTCQLDAAAKNKPYPCPDSFFVYGTLMRDERRFSVLQQCGIECVLLAKTFGRLVDLGDFPGLVAVGDSSSMVRGEFVRVRDPEKAVALLDTVEGFRGFGVPGSLYRRTRVGVDVGDARIREAWTYVLDCGTECAREIPTGDWREHRATRSGFMDRLAARHANGNEKSLASKLAEEIPFCFAGSYQEAIEALSPISDALATDTLSERRLAQASGNWSAIP